MGRRGKQEEEMERRHWPEHEKGCRDDVKPQSRPVVGWAPEAGGTQRRAVAVVGGRQAGEPGEGGESERCDEESARGVNWRLQEVAGPPRAGASRACNVKRTTEAARLRAADWALG